MADDTREQPRPVESDASTSVTRMVMADLLEREKKGIETYGTSLTTFNGRHALVDAYQEALDLSQYLKQAIMEKEKLTSALLWLYEHEAKLTFKRDGFGDQARVTLEWGVWGVYADDLLAAVQQACEVERVIQVDAWKTSADAGE